MYDFAPMKVIKEPRQIRAMFTAIAPRYDLLNHLLSLSVDRYWRRRTVRLLTRETGENRLILDLCTGTADLALLLARSHSVVGCDFSHSMLRLGLAKTGVSPFRERIGLIEGDALSLPFGDGVFDGVTVAFGLRNLENYEKGLREMRRILKPGGTAAVLEFSQPRFPVVREVYQFYFSRILPRLGEWISGRPGAYSYLCHSVRDFPGQRELEAITTTAGLHYLRYYSLTGGIAALHLARRE